MTDNILDDIPYFTIDELTTPGFISPTGMFHISRVDQPRWRAYTGQHPPRIYDFSTYRIMEERPAPRRHYPVWTTRDGREFYDPSEIANGHLINIFHWLIENERTINPWIIPELRRRGISLDTPRQPETNYDSQES